MSLTSLEKSLDKAFQKLAIDKRCHYCNRPATEIHHIKGRSDKLYRYDKRNALPICRKHHFDLHNGALDSPSVEFEHIGLRDYLMRENLIYDEFLQIKKKELGL